MKINKVSESIFSGKQCTIPMADVQHMEKRFYTTDLADGSKKGDVRGAMVITKHTKWSTEIDDWENPIYLPKEEFDNFMRAWTYYRYELEGGAKAFITPENSKKK